ncbi:MAG: cytochrome c biogenesis protein ResB [Blastocatellia bacterium]
MATSKSNVTGGSPETAVTPGIDVATADSTSSSESAGSWLGGAIDAILKLLSSVRFGLVMLGTLLACSMTGMLIMQINVEGFQKYYNALSPAKRAVYGSLGFFDIYHAWYFSLLLAITGLNIILASIDRFPTAWQYIKKPKLIASPKFIQAQMYSRVIAIPEGSEKLSGRILEAWQREMRRYYRKFVVMVLGLLVGMLVLVAFFNGSTKGMILGILGTGGIVLILCEILLVPVLSKRAVRISCNNERIILFAQKNVWNRLGAYAVHVALLTIFTGGFLTNRYGAGGSMEIEPGKSSDHFSTLQYSIDGPRMGTMTLPFRIECLDLQQKLVRPEGGLDAQNTIDWRSFIRIDDQGKQKEMLVHLNNVGDYRGYRFFQSQFSPIASARQVMVSFEPPGGGQGIDVTLKKNESVEVPGIGRVRFVAFYPDFDITGSAFTPVQGSEYIKPFAQLEIITPNGEKRATVALGPQAEGLFNTGKNGSDALDSELLINGKRAVLKDFEKVSRAHTLTIQYDPGRTPVYTGFVLLLLSLCSVFFFTHQRVWGVIESGESGGLMTVHIGGNVNRNRQGFEETFNKLVTLASSASD